MFTQKGTTGGPLDSSTSIILNEKATDLDNLEPAELSSNLEKPEKTTSSSGPVGERQRPRRPRSSAEYRGLPRRTGSGEERSYSSEKFDTTDEQDEGKGQPEGQREVRKSMHVESMQMENV